jgi:hypothetical protein
MTVMPELEIRRTADGDQPRKKKLARFHLNKKTRNGWFKPAIPAT